MKQTNQPPAPAPDLLPQSGGSYTRQPDGTLERRIEVDLAEAPQVSTAVDRADSQKPAAPQE